MLFIIILFIYLFFRISNLVRCQLDPLIEFVPVVLDKLLSLLVESPVTQHQQPMNLGQTIFRTLADLVSMTMVIGKLNTCILLYKYKFTKYFEFRVILKVNKYYLLMCVINVVVVTLLQQRQQMLRIIVRMKTMIFFPTDRNIQKGLINIFV